jgi:hypothetical protein
MAKGQIQFMSNAAINQVTNPARAAILKSIRDHLAQSAESDAVNGEEKAAHADVTPGDKDSSIELHGVPEWIRAQAAGVSERWRQDGS